MTNILWKPDQDLLHHSNMARFINYINDKHKTNLLNYQQLYIWSITYPQEFWIEIWNFCDIKASHSWEHVLVDGEQIFGAKWFAGAALNFAENLLKRNDNKVAIIFRNENGIRSSLSYAELNTAVKNLATALLQVGVKPHDRVAGYLPNIPETVIAMLATTSIGAIWSACSTDFGTSAVIDRFSQITPKILFTVDGHLYNGKKFNDLEKIKEIKAALPSVEKIIVIPYLKEHPEIEHLTAAVVYKKFVENDGMKIPLNPPFSKGEKKDIPPFEKGRPGGIFSYQQFPFNHPIYILYSSGTTGIPKCIVHGAGGTLIQHLKELILHTNLTENDTIFYYSTCGWMMWNWLVSSLAVGATIVLYDGSPIYPKADYLFDIIDEEKISIFGTSAKYISALEKANLKPILTHSLDSLKTILSTGSPLLSENFDYVYRDIKKNVCLSSISGGTDIVSCFVLDNPLLPVHRGEIQCIGLGMKVEVFNKNGEPVEQEKGELVCTAPFPSMPVSFWNDPGNKKYHKAYFEKFPHAWTHGDYAEITPHQGVIIYGRSDATLNPGGIRIGTAEIYRLVESLPEILDSIAVAQEWKNDSRIILFVKLQKEFTLNDALIERIQKIIREGASPHHVPAKIIQVADIPHTVSGKNVELAVRETIHQRPVPNIDAIANQEALDYFKNLKDLEN